MRRFKAFFLSVLLVLISCNYPATSTSPEVLQPFKPPEVKPPLPEAEIARIDSLLLKVMEQYKFNGNALIAIEGYPIFKFSNGYADLYKKTKLNFNTVFQIASVSKGFTAISVLILADRGEICLEDSVVNYIPEFPFENITVKQLLQHTSGLQNYMYFVDHQWEDGKPITNEDVLKLINDNNPQLNFRPGRRHLYNNTGYAMLALLVERVSGKQFYEFLKDEIFVPLDMDHSFGWNSTATDTITNIASGFTRRGWRYRSFAHNPLDEVLGDKSVYTTANDLFKWDQALYTNILVSDSLMEDAFAMGKTSRGREFKYGYGWRLNEIDGKKVVYHNGLWNGFTSSLQRYVDDRITIILLNNTNAPVASVVRQLYNTLQNELEKDDNLALENP